MNQDLIVKEIQIPQEDEYPIIWYFDSQKEMNFQENSSIHFFADFDLVCEFAQSLGISFLLIVPNDFAEQKLFEAFRNKDLCKRRLADFEEEEVLKDVVPEENLKLFKVYVFFTREDFESEIIENKSIEEDMAKFGISQIGRRFWEEFVFWERKLKGLEEGEFQKSDAAHDFEVMTKEKGYEKCREFERKMLKDLVKKRKQEKKEADLFCKSWRKLSGTERVSESS